MTTQPLKILMVEDNRGDALLLRETLLDIEPGTFELSWEDRAGKALERLKRNRFDAILLDLMLPDSQGLATLELVLSAAKGIPLIIVTGVEDEELAIRAIRQGAQDYLVKGRSDGSGIARAIRYAIDRKKAEETIRASEERFALALQGTQEGVWDWNIETNAVWYSPQYIQMLGYTEAEIESHISALQNLLHPDDKERVRQAMEAVLQGQCNYEIEFQLRHKDGHYVDILSRGFPIRQEADGPIVRIVGTHVDLTERKRAEAALRKAHDELEQRVRERTAQLEVANKEMETFCYSIAHDFQAPLRSIDGFSQIILEEAGRPLNKASRDSIERIRAAAHKMARLLDDQLTLSRFTRMEMKWQDVDLSLLAEIEAQNILERELLSRDVEFIIAKGLVAKGDSNLLCVVLQNLLENAWKFTSKKPKARIEFGALNRSEFALRFPPSESDRQVFFVSDNGAGFNMAYANQLFLPFHRLHSEEEFSGLGIGLTIVQRIIQRHGGQVWAKGEVEKGATFFFSL